MGCHIPNDVFRNNNRVTNVDMTYLPSVSQAIQMYSSETGGRISKESGFGEDPLKDDLAKSEIRRQSFMAAYPSFNDIFSKVVNCNSVTFRNALLFYNYRYLNIAFLTLDFLLLIINFYCLKTRTELCLIFLVS